MENLSILLAFGAGLLSFLSPCVLPLIPSYLSFIGGTGKDGEEPSPGDNRRLIIRTLGFILGFSIIFIAMSVLLSGAFFLFSGIHRIISLIAGGMVILLGLNVLFDFLSFLNYEKRIHPLRRPRNILGAFLAGAAFGAGWTPCVGPILGSILLLAGQSGGVLRAALYLAAYSAGLGLPFLGAALFLSRFLAKSAKLRSHLPLIRRISGILLIVIGVIIIAGRYQTLNILFIKAESAFIAWARQGGLPVRFIPALIFFCAAVIPPLIRFLRKKALFSWGLLISSCFWGILTVLQAAGLLDSAGILAHWLLYRQGV